MNPSLFSQCQAYLTAHSLTRSIENERPPVRAVTISRETGAGAISISEMVTERLEAQEGGDGRFPWAVFDRELVKKVLEDHQLPESFAQYMPEDAAHKIDDALEDILGLHPASRTLVQHINHTILRLAYAGNVVLVGRGAHLVTAKLKHVLHVRLIAPLDFRIQRIQDYHNLNPQEAAEYIRKADLARSRYVRANFEARAQDPLQFHFTINTGRVSFPDAAKLIADAVLNMELDRREALVV